MLKQKCMYEYNADLRRGPAQSQPEDGRLMMRVPGMRPYLYQFLGGEIKKILLTTIAGL